MANTQAQTISLTLEPYKEEETVEKAETEIQEVMSEDNLSEEERQMVESFAKQIDVANSEMILHYGAAAQTKMANFSETTLNSVKTKDLGEVGKLMTDLVGELKSIDEGDDDKGWNIFKKAKDKATTLKARYTSAENNVNHIVEILEGHQIQLMKDIAMLDEMYQMNLQNFKELSLYIIAGKKKLIQARDVELENLKKKAMASGLPEDSQAANDFASLCDRFEKKIHDLEGGKTV